MTTNLYAELKRRGVDINEYTTRIMNAGKEMFETENEYLFKIEKILKEVLEENEQLKAQISRLKEDKEENENTFTKLLKQQEALYKNIKTALGGKE